MPALDAFHTKVEIHNALDDPVWHRFAEAFTRSLRGEPGSNNKPGALPQKGFTHNGPTLTRLLRTTLSLAETYYIAPEMNALVTAAAESWEPDEAIHAEDFPTNQGFLWIPGGIATIDVRGSLLTTKVITWSRRGGGVDIVQWADKHDDPPHMREQQGEGWAAMTRFSPWHVSGIGIGDPLPQTLRVGTLLPPEVSREVQWIEGPNNSLALAISKGWDYDQMVPQTGPDPILAWLVTTLRIMQQPLAHVETQGLPAGVRKSLARYPRKMKNTRVTVIELRRREGEFEPGSGREYSHRFLRRGHWRRQWVGSELTGDRRQVRLWIHPTVVGPADKPLILREHVNALTR